MYTAAARGGFQKSAHLIVLVDEIVGPLPEAFAPGTSI